MKKLVLVNPVGQKSGYLLSRFSRFQPLSLAYVAAVTPTNWEVEIVDENFEDCKFPGADLVAITAFTSNVNRAYQIAETYRKKKTPVVMGGIHASMLPDEALQHSDAVVFGEVENIWGQLIDDLEGKKLASKYVGPKIDFLQSHVKPRRDLLHEGYLWQSIQTSRGCPFNCNFCSVSKYLGRQYRQRKPDSILEELKEIEGDYIAFIDDNLIGHSLESKERAKALFEGIISNGLNKKWWMQTSINSTEDEDLVKLMSLAGCMFVFIGFETTNIGKLKNLNKNINIKTGVNNYKNVVNRFHKYGIGVMGAFIIGQDNENYEYYKELSRFMKHSGIDMFQISILTPLPGTDLFDELQSAGRLVYTDFPADWDKYRLSHLVHNPIGIDPESIYIGNNYLKNELYSFPHYNFRLLNSALKLRRWSSVYAVKKLNKALRKSWESSHYYQKYPKCF